MRDPDETLEALVAGVFGERERRTTPDETVLVPPTAPVPVPEPAAAATPATAPAAAERGPAAPARETDEAPPKRSLLRRLQVSPAVIVASIIAGATGAAADAWFEDLAGFFSELTSPHQDLTAPAPADLLPVDVAPSRFVPAEASAAEPEPEASGPAAQPPVPGPAAAPRMVPAATAATPATAASAAPATAAPASRVRVITWEETAAGTVVTFWGDGAFLDERVVRFRVAGGTPRELVKLRGIDVPFPQTVLEPGTPEVRRIRTGFHPQDRVNELHVVLDLSGPEVVVERVETGPETLRVHLARGGPATP